VPDVTPISPDLLRAYLAVSGWTLVGEGNAGQTWSRIGDDEAPTVLVPGFPADPNYDQLLSSALARLAYASETAPDVLIEQILERTTDALEVRVRDPTTAAGRINLERGVQLTKSLFEIVLNGARVWTLGARPLFRRTPDEARAIIARLELAPPAPGSFRMEVVAPAEVHLELDPHLIPFSPVRQVLVSTLAALQAAAAAAEVASAGVSDPDALDDAIESGVSANLVQAITALDTQSTGLELEFRARWGYERPPDLPDVVRLEPRHLAALPALEGALRKQEPQDDFELHGWIKTVGADELAIDQPLSGFVVVEARVEGRSRDVYVELRSENLMEAAQHLGRRFMLARGTLEKIGRRWYLTDPRDVEIR
jgi:hypothetical protein